MPWRNVGERVSPVVGLHVLLGGRVPKMACPDKWKQGHNLRSDSWRFKFDPYPNGDDPIQALRCWVKLGPPALLVSP